VAHHEPALDRNVGAIGTAAAEQAPSPRSYAACGWTPAIEPRHRLDVVVEDAGVASQDRLKGRLVAADIGIRTSTRQVAEAVRCLQGAGEDPRPAVGSSSRLTEVSTGVPQAEVGHRLPPRAAARPRRPCRCRPVAMWQKPQRAGADVARIMKVACGGSSTRRCWGSGPTRRPCANADRPPAISGRR